MPGFDRHRVGQHLSRSWTRRARPRAWCRLALVDGDDLRPLGIGHDRQVGIDGDQSVAAADRRAPEIELAETAGLAGDVGRAERRHRLLVADVDAAVDVAEQRTAGGGLRITETGVARRQAQRRDRCRRRRVERIRILSRQRGQVDALERGVRPAGRAPGHEELGVAQPADPELAHVGPGGIPIEILVPGGHHLRAADEGGLRGPAGADRHDDDGEHAPRPSGRMGVVDREVAAGAQHVLHHGDVSAVRRQGRALIAPGLHGDVGSERQDAEPLGCAGERRIAEGPDRRPTARPLLIDHGAHQQAASIGGHRQARLGGVPHRRPHPAAFRGVLSARGDLPAAVGAIGSYGFDDGAVDVRIRQAGEVDPLPVGPPHRRGVAGEQLGAVAVGDVGRERQEAHVGPVGTHRADLGALSLEDIRVAGHEDQPILLTAGDGSDLEGRRIGPAHVHAVHRHHPDPDRRPAEVARDGQAHRRPREASGQGAPVETRVVRHQKRDRRWWLAERSVRVVHGPLHVDRVVAPEDGAVGRRGDGDRRRRAEVSLRHDGAVEQEAECRGPRRGDDTLGEAHRRVARSVEAEVGLEPDRDRRADGIAVAGDGYDDEPAGVGALGGQRRDVAVVEERVEEDRVAGDGHHAAHPVRRSAALRWCPFGADMDRSGEQIPGLATDPVPRDAVVARRHEVGPVDQPAPADPHTRGMPAVGVVEAEVVAELVGQRGGRCSRFEQDRSARDPGAPDAGVAQGLPEPAVRYDADDRVEAGDPGQQVELTERLGDAGRARTRREHVG